MTAKDDVGGCCWTYILNIKQNSVLLSADQFIDKTLLPVTCGNFAAENNKISIACLSVASTWRLGLDGAVFMSPAWEIQLLIMHT